MTEDQITYDRLKDLLKETLSARKGMHKASAARQALPPGSTRARVTTANARHASACEHYDRMRDALLKVFATAIGSGGLEW